MDKFKNNYESSTGEFSKNLCFFHGIKGLILVKNHLDNNESSGKEMAIDYLTEIRYEDMAFFISKLMNVQFVSRYPFGKRRVKN